MSPGEHLTSSAGQVVGLVLLQSEDGGHVPGPLSRGQSDGGLGSEEDGEVCEGRVREEVSSRGDHTAPDPVVSSPGGEGDVAGVG